jgi:heptaprenyl diphosphate synthase
MADGLRRTEDELRKVVESDDPFLTEMARHLIDAGGKRVRPALAITASLVLDEDPDVAPWAVIRGGVAVELVHQGSLYHDDVIDDAETRRTVQSVNARWGNLEAILAGDYLLARASEIAADLGTEVAGLLAATIAALCEGQVREVRHAFDVDRSEEAYLASISGKTASLLATAARIGAIVADHSRDVVDAVTDFGHNYGMAFQVVDDLLDVTATDEELGKPSGNDLMEGTYTLPVIRALAGPAGDDLRSLLGGPIDSTGRDRARELVRADGAISSTRETAVGYLADARVAIAGLPANPAVGAMLTTCDLLVERLDRTA